MHSSAPKSIIIGRLNDLSFSKSILLAASEKSELVVFCDVSVVEELEEAVSCDSSVVISEELEVVVSVVS